MKSAIRSVAALAATATSTVMCAFTMLTPPAMATLFAQQEVDQNRVVAVAAPVGNGSAHQLLILEQINNSRQCWNESGSSPTVVDPLLLNFDFTGICGRSTDSNGYSVRVGGEDLGWRYSLRVVRTPNDLKLMAVSTSNRNAPAIEIGKTNGITNNFAKFELNPGWRLTKRVYNGQPIGHIYLTNNQNLETLIAAAAPVPATPAPAPTPTTPPPASRPTPSNPLPAPPVVVVPGSGAPSPGPIVVPTVPVTPTPRPTPSAPAPAYNGPAPAPTPLASQLGFSYRVVVPASTLSDQVRVRAAVPEAFRTTLNGQVVMQVGLFRERADADEFRQNLSSRGLQASVISVAESSPQVPVAQPPTNPAPVTNPPQVPNSRIVVVIDPGHGGRDPGAVGVGGLRETDVVLPISRRVASLLEQQGIQVVLTRQDEREIDLSPRVAIAERANADVFVSIHANAATNSAALGTETYYASSTGYRLAEAIQTSMTRETGMVSRGTKTARFYVLTQTSMPAALVEVGFVTNASDAARLRDAAFQNRMADAIARGILQYVQQTF